MKKVGVVLVLLCAVAVLAAAALSSQLTGTAVPAALGTSVTTVQAQNYLTRGKQYLGTQNILAARDQFRLAVQVAPDSQEANLLLGLSRIAAVAEDGQALRTSGLDSVREILELCGFVVRDLNIYAPQVISPKKPADSTPGSGMVLAFLKDKLIPEVDGAIANLAKVTDPGFIAVLAPAALGRASGSDLYIDYADAMVIRSLVYALKCNLDLLMVYGLDVALPSISQAPQELMTYKALLNGDATLLAPVDPARLTTARSALIGFIDTYRNLAVPALMARPGNLHHLFVLDAPVGSGSGSLSSQGVTEVSNALAEVKAALSGPKLLSFVKASEDRNRTVDLSKFFDASAPISPRSKVADCGSAVVLPDATLGGLFPLGLNGYQSTLARLGSENIVGVACPGRGAPNIETGYGLYFYEFPGNLTWTPAGFVSEGIGNGSGPQQLTISNHGTATLHLSSISLQGPDSAAFSLAPGTCGSLTPQIAPGSSCALLLDIKRPVAGPPPAGSFYFTYSAGLSLVSDDPLHGLKLVSLYGQLATTAGGSISGTIRETGSGAVPGFTMVDLYDYTTGAQLATTYAYSGGYAFNGLNAGSYKIRINSGSQTVWYNDGGAVVLAGDAHLTNVNLSVPAYQPEVLPAATSLAWGSVWHRLKASGGEEDLLDVGLETSAGSLTGLSVVVEGPAGFSYTFSDADKVASPSGILALAKTFPYHLAAGVYTFTLTDPYGTKQYRSATRGAGTTGGLPVTLGNLTYQRTGDGGYRFRWPPVYATKSYYYQLVITDASGAVLYQSPRSMSCLADVPGAGLPAPPSDPQLYWKARVLVFDAVSNDLTTGGSEGSATVVTPGAYDGNEVLTNAAALYNRTDSAGVAGSDLFLSVDKPDSVSQVELHEAGTGGLIYTLQAADRSRADFYHRFVPPLAPGSYLLNYGGKEARLTLGAPAAIAKPITETMQVEDQGNGYLRFSWANVDHTGPLYYRVLVADKGTGLPVDETSFTTPGRNVTYLDIDSTRLGNLAARKWRVEVSDSSDITSERNRTSGDFIDLVPVAYDPERPVISSWRVRNLTSAAGVTRSQVQADAQATGATLAELRVTGPNGYSRDLLGAGRFSPADNAFVIEEQGSAGVGLWTLEARDSSGRSARRYLFQPAPHAVPAVDMQTARLNYEPAGNYRLSWAPVQSDTPVWYRVELFRNADFTGDGLMDPPYLPLASFDVDQDGSPDALSLYPLTSVAIPGDVAFTKLLMGVGLVRITTRDGGEGVVALAGRPSVVEEVSRNAAQSVMVGATFGYPISGLGAATDADGDGFAASADANDGNPTVYPLSSGDQSVPLRVTSTTPYPGAPGVSGSASICVSFNKALDQRTLAGNFTLSEGVAATLSFRTGTDVFAASTACLETAAPLPASALITATVGLGIKDLSGASLAAPYTWSFSTGSTLYSAARPGGGSFTAAQSITLSANAASAEIYYTTDGTAPSYPASGTTQRYTGPIDVTATTLLKFFARDGGISEPYNTQLYSIGSPVAAVLAGDSDGNGVVTIAELQSAINMYLGLKPVETCVDYDGDGAAGIAEVQKAVNAFVGL